MNENKVIKNKIIEDNSNPGLFMFLAITTGIIGAIWTFYKIYNHGFSYNLSEFILPGVLLLLCIIFSSVYSKEKSRKDYFNVCKSMEYWIGSSLSDLISDWGAPNRTYKFPQDKTMTVLEYKDSIRNYASYSTRTYHKGYSTGISTGQSKTTKYIKSFFVKEGYIINYKYSIQ
jgi:hypothetical protein